MKPVKLIPTCKDYLWGGTRLYDQYSIGNGGVTAEAWVLSARDNGPCFIADGEYKGKTLAEVFEAEGKEVWGSRAQKFPEFPVLIKLIDAAKNLSIQVHPSDEYALKNEGEYGKTEMWYVVDAEPGAFLYAGFKEEIGKEEFEKSIADNTVTDLLNKIEVKKGDSIFIPAGTVHAIGAGLLIAEVQQNSDLTYRVYDYARLGADGKPRELHIEKALKVALRMPPEQDVCHASEANKVRIAQCEYFFADVLNIPAEKNLTVDEGSFASLLCLEGSVCAGPLSLKAGECAFVPAGFGEMALSGSGKLLVSGV